MGKFKIWGKSTKKLNFYLTTILLRIDINRKKSLNYENYSFNSKILFDQINRKKKLRQSHLIIQYNLYNLLQSHLIIQYTLIVINVYTIYKI